MTSTTQSVEDRVNGIMPTTIDRATHEEINRIIRTLEIDVRDHMRDHEIVSRNRLAQLLAYHGKCLADIASEIDRA